MIAALPGESKEITIEEIPLVVPDEWPEEAPAPKQPVKEPEHVPA